MTFLYIDPGTGSMLFSILIGVAAAATFGIRTLVLKIKFLMSKDKESAEAFLQTSKIPLVIYSDHKRYWNVFKPICDELEKRNLKTEFYTSSSDDPCLKEDYKNISCKFIGEGNKAFSKLNLLNAKILISTTPGLDVYQWKRSKSVDWYVHVPHSIDDIPATYRMFGLDYYDAVLTTGTHQEAVIRKLEKLRNLPQKEIVTAGCTYLDSMLETKKQKNIEIANERPLVLVAPSWGKNGILSKFGSTFIDSLLSTGFDIVIRPHPQSFTAEKELLESLQEKYKTESNLTWNFDNNNFEILSKADVMISDFSGVIYDYSFIFDKPVIYADTEFDTIQYDADWLDQKIWSLRVLPDFAVKLEEKDFPQIKTVIENAMNSRSLAVERKKVSDEAWQNKGNAAKTIADYLISKLGEL